VYIEVDMMTYSLSHRLRYLCDKEYQLRHSQVSTLPFSDVHVSRYRTRQQTIYVLLHEKRE